MPQGGIPPTRTQVGAITVEPIHQTLNAGAKTMAALDIYTSGIELSGKRPARSAPDRAPFDHPGKGADPPTLWVLRTLPLRTP